MSKEFIKLLLDHNVVRFSKEGFTLKSGAHSYWYINGRDLSTCHQSLEATARHVCQCIVSQQDLFPVDAVVAVPEGASLLGYEVNRQLIFQGLIPDRLYHWRLQAKTHGDPSNRFWVNGQIPKRVIILEDVTTSGGSIMELAAKLQSMGVEVLAAIALLSRAKQWPHALRLNALAQEDQLLPMAISQLEEPERSFFIEKYQKRQLN